MRWTDLTESSREPSPELVQWIADWVESSFRVEDKADRFAAIADEASVLLNVSYPAIYRGLSITDEDADKLGAGQSITIPAHRLQSWTKSRGIAKDFALPGHGGDIGLLIRKTGRQVPVVVDVENVVRRIGRRRLKQALGSHDRATDAAREREVVVQTDGTLTIHARDVVEMV